MSNIGPKLVTLLITMLNYIVPDGMKVYVLSIIGIVVGILAMWAGDATTGGTLIWGSLLALSGRHSVEKLSNTIIASVATPPTVITPIVPTAPSPTVPPFVGDEVRPTYTNDGWK